MEDRHEIKALIVSHSDLPSLMTFSANEPAVRCGLEVTAVEAVVDRLSMRPGELGNENPEHLFTANPVWLRPLVKLGADEIFCPMPQVFFGFVHEIFENLIDELGFAKKLEHRRSEYLEAATARAAARSARSESTQKTIRSVGMFASTQRADCRCPRLSSKPSQSCSGSEKWYWVGSNKQRNKRWNRNPVKLCFANML